MFGFQKWIHIDLNTIKFQSVYVSVYKIVGENLENIEEILNNYKKHKILFLDILFEIIVKYLKQQ